MLYVVLQHVSYAFTYVPRIANSAVTRVCKLHVVYTVSHRFKIELHDVHTTYTKVWELHEPPVVNTPSISTYDEDDDNNSDDSDKNTDCDNNDDGDNNDSNDTDAEISDGNNVVDSDTSDDEVPLSTSEHNGHTVHIMPIPASSVDRWNERRVGEMFIARLPLTNTDREAIGKTGACRVVHIVLAYFPCLNGVETSKHLTELEDDVKIPCLIEGR
jgi:hypothetical protein